MHKKIIITIPKFFYKKSNFRKLQSSTKGPSIYYVRKKCPILTPLPSSVALRTFSYPLPLCIRTHESRPLELLETIWVNVILVE